ncbi:5-deoxy-glucuronate isomerase [Streptomyces sp. LN549]|uniref:5-deoxy-glucuronate isomerase n=1 Tax=Streptomyces sp. LN549 TaxID=3112979 RepID=UPI00371738AA
MDGHQPAGHTAHGPWSVDTGMRHTGLRVLELGPGGSQSFGTQEREVIVLPLSGSCSVRCGPQELGLAGRPGVFEGVSDFAYVPRRSDAVMAGPHAERAWRITDDPAHAWVRETWDGVRAASGAPSTEGAA